MKSACITEKPNREKQHIPNSLTLFHIHLSYVTSIVILYLSLFLHMFPLPSLTHAINSCRFDADVCLNLLEYRELFLDINKYKFNNHVLSNTISTTTFLYFLFYTNVFIIVWFINISPSFVNQESKFRLKHTTTFHYFLLRSQFSCLRFCHKNKKNIAIMLSKIALCLDIIFQHVSNIMKFRRGKGIVVDGEIANQKLGIQASSTNQWFSVIHAHMWWVRRRNFGPRVDVTRNLNNKKKETLGYMRIK